ncbi:hypothetical protein [Shewanella sp. CAL98-MNA-CIBAN-0140]|uniref:hypothetical protein n=1 Tax=Shewanella sp. CAL98-MNA-CIBAN-0140 TaxID=3140462 RepID=UPI00332C75B8
MELFTDRNYKLEDAAHEPVIYLAKLMKLEQYSTYIRSHSDRILPILIGVLLYRQLSRPEQNKILPMTNSLKNPQFLNSIQALLSQNIANPNWNKWCLSNSELRDYFQSNKTVSEFIGTWFFTVEPKLEVSFLASSIFSVAALGASGFALEASGGAVTESMVSSLSKKTGLNITKSSVRAVGRSTIIVMILASTMKMLSDSDMKLAKKELLRRGLLNVEDL